jgi:hypothetical protein
MLSPHHVIYLTDALSFKSFSPGEILRAQGERSGRMLISRSVIVSIQVYGKVRATHKCSGNVYGRAECKGYRVKADAELSARVIEFNGKRGMKQDRRKRRESPLSDN